MEVERRQEVFRYIKYFITILALYNCDFAVQAHAATISASSCSQADVQAAIDSANSGDIVSVPACTATWSSSVVITKGVRLQGAGIAVTVIKNGIPASRDSDYLIRYLPVSPEDDPYVEITGFTLDANHHGGGITVRNISNLYQIRNFRIHHNKFLNSDNNGSGEAQAAVRIKGSVYGLLDNCIFTDNYNDYRLQGNDDNSWTIPLNHGTAEFFYMENNTHIRTTNMNIESGEGTRWVSRYNSIDASAMGSGDQIWDAHGNTLNRGTVGIEVYENTSTGGYSFSTLDLRGGSGIIYNNSVESGPSCNTIIKIREEDCYVYGTDCSYSGQDPITNSYLWNNVVSNHGNEILCMEEGDDPTANMIEENRDYWTDMDPWTIGGESPSNFFYGIAADRPKTCGDNDSYWEKDTKRLYRCIGTNNWTFIYNPYTYPHPLTNAPPSSPQNLRIN